MKKINSRDRSWKNEKYLAWIRSLPCCITGQMNCTAHHVTVTGRKGIKNDHYAIPVTLKEHFHKGEITRQYIEDKNNEDPRDLIIFYLSLYIEKLQGRYDEFEDQQNRYRTLRQKKGEI